MTTVEYRKSRSIHSITKPDKDPKPQRPRISPGLVAPENLEGALSKSKRLLEGRLTTIKGGLFLDGMPVRFPLEIVTAANRVLKAAGKPQIGPHEARV